MHSLYGESKSVPGLVHARSCVSFCVCGEIRWASRKRKVTYCWPNFPWSALLSPSACQTSLLPHSKELRVCKDRGGGKGRKSEKVGGMKRGSPVQGAPASCRPGDGLDIASPLSSEKKTKRQWMLVNMLFYKAIPSITCNTDTYQKQTFVWFSTAASHMNKIYKISKTQTTTWCIPMSICLRDMRCMSSIHMYVCFLTRFAELSTQWANRVQLCSLPHGHFLHSSLSRKSIIHQSTTTVTTVCGTACWQCSLQCLSVLLIQRLLNSAAKNWWYLSAKFRRKHWSRCNDETVNWWEYAPHTHTS